jgi:hypothetical protein
VDGSSDFAGPFAGARWVDIVPRLVACPALPAEVLLHAGPPLRGVPPVPMMNAAIQALLFEGRAANPAEARDLVLRREVRLSPAQDHAVVTPLAQVVSASMPLVVVEQQGAVCHAPVVEGPAPGLRFGCAAPESLQRLRDISAWLDRCVTPCLRREPPAVDALIRIAIAGGDECHARTAVANEALISWLCGAGLDAADAVRLRSNPAFVLPVLMAAAGTALRRHRCGVEAIGGNGVDFGVRHRGESQWRRVRAEAPRGVRFDGMNGSTALPAIGDSAVVDYCGLGGQALAAAPAVVAEWHEVLPEEVPEEVLSRRHVLIDPDTGIVDAARVSRSGRAPLINLAILDQDGAGLIGRGFYSPPLELFTAAPAAMDLVTLTGVIRLQGKP